MKLRRKERVPVEAVEATASTADEPADSPLRGWWVPKAVAGGLWAIIAVAVGFSVLAWARPVASSAPAPVVMGEEARWDVSGFSELFVSQYVDAGTGDEASLAPFMGNSTPPALTGSEAGEWFASSTTTTAVVSTGRDSWRVTVATGLLRRDTETESYVSMGVRFFEVEIVATDTGLSATGLPWIASAPPVGDSVDGGWGTEAVPTAGDPLADTAERFLTALLTGNGELGRYAAPGSELRAVPATFDLIELERLANRRDREGNRWIRATVKATSSNSVLWLTYDLMVEERDGRWEIAAMGPEPVATETPESPAPTTTIPVEVTTTQGG